MPGFSRMDQARIALIVQAHRGSLVKTWPSLSRPNDIPLVLALRLAALFSRGRGGVEIPSMKLARRNDGFELTVDKAWLEHHPLTETALGEEISQWQSLGVDLRLR